MQNITKNYKLGFGSFVDKTVTPFLRTEYVYEAEFQTAALTFTF